ncbi:MAG: MBL fold metallo-hydrolase [Clostridia bacterium]|nr:MBL fold metallo-hydrolase [Clostridia bacterium]
MLIKHIGHAEFLVETESGVRIATDPYDAGCGYPLRKVKADIALISHHHHDHDAVENLKGSPRMIDTAGKFTPEPDVKITAIRGFHDDAEGAKRGETLMFLIETEGLRIVHLGDLGCALNEEQAEILKAPDVLMIPVGGFYTIDAEQARETASRLGARIILPMHYRTEYNKDWPISDREAFISLYDPAEICGEAEALRVTRGDIEYQPKVVVFRQ